MDLSNNNNNPYQRPTSPITPGHFCLLLVGILYASLNVTLRGVYGLPDPPTASALSAVRGWLAVACFAPLVAAKLRRKAKAKAEDDSPTSSSSSDLWKVAAELAVWNFGAQGLATVGLLYVSAARAAFLCQLSVVITPCLSALSGSKVQSNVWWACAFALAGLVMMTQSNTEDDHTAPTSGGVGLGDLFCLGGALSWSTYLFRLSSVGDRFDEIQLQATKTFLMAFLYSAWCATDYLLSEPPVAPWVGWTNLLAWALLFYSALGPGMCADILQQKGQASTSATVSNIILSLEPAFAAVFGRVLLGERTDNAEKVGGCLILAAAVLATLRES